MRWRLVWSAGALAFLLLATGAASWWLAARALDQAIQRWVEARRSDGYTVEWRARAIGGFPLWIRARFEQPALTAPGGATPWSWQAESLTLAARPWNPTTVSFEGQGRNLLVLAIPQSVQVTSDAVHGSLVLGLNRPLQGEMEVAAPALWTEKDTPSASARRLDVALDKYLSGQADERTESAAGRLSLEGLALAPPLAQRLPFSEPIDLSLALSLFGTVPVDSPARALARWRDAGGIVEISRLDLNWGPLGLTGNGTVALDEEMRPLGAGTASIRGWDATLERLVALGAVATRQASIARVVLSALSKPTPAGAEVTVPLTAQDGKLSVGPVPIMPLPKIVP
ncbi:MAG: DUF2125 domain-containing protein [Proteobacteria bacterium]|nr:DUF2125 domain-containing protein [Pseudomonadota bacterium]MBI3499394.1 DUF2125 domain-containing protein [Pseudomonadota bacterium]